MTLKWRHPAGLQDVWNGERLPWAEDLGGAETLHRWEDPGIPNSLEWMGKKQSWYGNTMAI